MDIVKTIENDNEWLRKVSKDVDLNDKDLLNEIIVKNLTNNEAKKYIEDSKKPK